MKKTEREDIVPDTKMEKGKAIVGRRWAVEFTDNSSTPSTRDIPDPPGFTRASQEQVHSINFLIVITAILSSLSLQAQYFS